MPNYDFHCSLCSTTREIWLDFNDEQLPNCEKCHVAMKKVFQATPAHFKGGGWGGQ